MRVGTNREIDTDVRVIAATNRDPEEAVADGKLRADLYHRLNVFPLQLPQLRERGKDVRTAGAALPGPAQRAQQHQEDLPAAGDGYAAAPYNWPGNVRELRNYVQRAYIMSDDTGISTRGCRCKCPPRRRPSGSTLTIPVGTSLASADKKIILATLEQWRRREEACRRTARHQPQDAVQPPGGIRQQQQQRG